MVSNAFEIKQEKVFVIMGNGLVLNPLTARGGFQSKANPRLRKEITELADVVDKDNARDIPVDDGRLEREVIIKPF